MTDKPGLVTLNEAFTPDELARIMDIFIKYPIGYHDTVAMLEIYGILMSYGVDLHLIISRLIGTTPHSEMDSQLLDVLRDHEIEHNPDLYDESSGKLKINV